MNTMIPIALIIMFIWKHLVCDFLMQGPYQFLNKGNAAHFGGYLHAGINALGIVITFAIIAPNLGYMIIFLGIMEFATHYAIDYAKVNLNEKMSWHYETKEYWFSLGIDQTIHWLMYVVLALMAFGMNFNDFLGVFILSVVFSFISVLVSWTIFKE